MAKGIYSLLPKHYAMRLSDHHGCQMAIARFFRIVQGDHSSCLKPPVDFNLIARHVNSGEYFVSFSNLGLGSDVVAKHMPVHQHHNHGETYRFSTYKTPSTIDMPCYEIEVNGRY